MAIKELFFTALRMMAGPVAGLVVYGVVSKKSKNVYLTGLAGGAAMAVATMAQVYYESRLQQNRMIVGALPSANMRERRRTDSGEPIYALPSRGGQYKMPNTGTPQQGPYGTISALQMEAVRGMCKTCG